MTVVSYPRFSLRSFWPCARALVVCAFVCLVSTFAAADEIGGLLDTDGLSVGSWEEAGQLIGRPAVIYGEIAEIGHAKGISFLNFAKGRRGEFCGVIFERDDDAFDEVGKDYEELYLNKKVELRGSVSVYRGTPQIVINSPDQITIVDEFPESKIAAPLKIEIGDELVIGSYNIKNLFDDKDDPYHSDEGTNPKPRDEMVRVAKVMREINADVLALQEVESRGYLQKFVDAMLYDMGYKHIVQFEGNDGRGIDVCLISRIPVGEVTSHRHHVFEGHDGKGQRFGRDLLRVELLPEGGNPFEVWIVHLKSNSGGKELNEPIRLGECREVHRIIKRRLEQNPEVSLILCGDFNDEYDTKTMQTIQGEPALLKTTFDDVPEESRVTYNRNPYRSMIDFMLCSPAMADRMVPGSFRIRAGTNEDSGSDHNPILARFQKGTSGQVATTQKVADGGAKPVKPMKKPAKNAMKDSVNASASLSPSVNPETKVVYETQSIGMLGLAGMGVLGLALLGAAAMIATMVAKPRS